MRCVLVNARSTWLRAQWEAVATLLRAIITEDAVSPSPGPRVVVVMHLAGYPKAIADSLALLAMQQSQSGNAQNRVQDITSYIASLAAEV